MAIIKPRGKRSTGAATGAGGGSSKSSSIICPLLVKIPLPDLRGLKIGTKLELKTVGGNLKIFAGVVELATVPAQKAKKLAECIAIGFRYPGSVRVGKEGNAYAEFRRTTGA